MATAAMLDRALYATLFEVERGLFHAQYRSSGFGPGSAIMLMNTSNLPVYQVADTATDARRRIETTARLEGYDLVIWDDLDTDSVPPRTLYGQDRLPQGQAVLPG
jgi:hypothetical protein